MKRVILSITILLAVCVVFLALSTSSAESNPEAGLDTSLFMENALAQDISIEDCTLSDGTETTCYSITVTGTPANHDVGPFCPTTTSATADEVGIWLDGDAQYDIDGEFILNLAEIYEDSNWKLYNDDGTVRVTETAEAFNAAARPDVDPEYQNHCVEGQMEWLDGGTVSSTVLIPTTPVPASSTTTSDPMGVTLNGIVIAPAAPVQAILGAYTIAAFDDCGGHINPVAGYHLHGAVGCSEVGEAHDGETPIFAYAMDGYPVHSYDETVTDLDECNGHTTDELGYHYHAGPAEGNSVLSCFTGAIIESAATNGGGQGGRGQGGPPGGGGRPDFAAAAEKLGVTEETLMAALGGPPPDFTAAASTLGVSMETLQEAMGQ